MKRITYSYLLTLLFSAPARRPHQGLFPIWSVSQVWRIESSPLPDSCNNIRREISTLAMTEGIAIIRLIYGLSVLRIMKLISEAVITPQQVSERTGVPIQTIFTWLKKGVLKGYR